MAKFNCDNIGRQHIGRLLFQRPKGTKGIFIKHHDEPTEEDKEVVRDWLDRAPQRAIDVEEDRTLDLLNLVLTAEEKLGPAADLSVRVVRLEKARRKVFQEKFFEAAKACAFKDPDEQE